jgi:hypothetical protein
VPQLARRPLGGVETGRGGDAAEPAPDVGSIERGACFGGEDEIGISSVGAGELTLGVLPLVLLVERFYAAFG